MRRVTGIVLLAFGMVLGSASGAAAQVDELVKKAETASYSGEQTVVCNTPDGRTSEVFQVGQANGVVVSRDSAGIVRATSVTPASQWDAELGYALVDRGERRFLQRPVTLVELLEDDQLRLRLRFDVSTGVLLASDVYNEDGSLYCSSRFLSFEPGDGGIAASVDLEALELAPTDDFNVEALPEQIAGFDRLSVTEGPRSEIVSAHYGDGVFSFTVLNAPRVIDVPELADAPRVEIGDHEYQRQFTLGTAVVAWPSAEGGFVMIGELPLDLQADVLAELPAPRRSLLDRLWRLFD